MSVTVLCGDAIAKLRDLPADSVHCVVSSPPYWGLRDYGTGTWEGGEAGCDHRKVTRADAGEAKSGLEGGKKTNGHQQEGFGEYCGRCGARRIDQQIGLEATRRVLRPDGVCFVNIGDSYCSNAGGAPGDSVGSDGYERRNRGERGRSTATSGLKPKDLIGQPWALAQALRAPYYTGRIKDERDRVWLAAMLDAEGCIAGNRHVRKDQDGIRTAIFVTITNSCMALLGKVQEIWPGCSLRHDHGVRLGTKEVMRWAPSGMESCGELLRELYPYFVSKKRQALLAWNLCNFSKTARRDCRFDGAEELRQKRELICQLISDCNQGRPVDLPTWLKEPPSLHEQGWWLRSEVIWSKPNPMPESVTDRPTKAHEQVFLLTKSGEPTFWLHRDLLGVRSRPEPDYRWVHKQTGEEVAEDPGDPDNWKRINLWRGRDYFYDAEAVREVGSENTHATGPNGYLGSRDNGAILNGDRNDKGRTCGVSSAGRNLRSVWQIATEPFPEAHFACVDQETECLTVHGWRRHGDLYPGLLAAQFDLDTKRLSWAPIEDVARYDVRDQEMVVGSRRDLEMWLTPNHRCVIQRRHTDTRKAQAPTIVRADALLPSHIVPTAGEWDHQGDASLPLEWAELLGWYVAEGHESKQSLSVEIYQSETANGAKCRRIEDLLRQTGVEWTAARARRQWRGRDSISSAYRIIGYGAARLRELAPGKRLPWSCVLWSNDRIEALLDGLIEGDGHTRADGRRCFVQGNKDAADLVQALAMRLGYSAMLSGRPGGMWTVYLTKHHTRSFRGTSGRGAPLERRAYTGVVWCPKLPASTWVARRNGKPFITGNTFPTELARRCILAGTSAKGCCPACGAPWARVVETEQLILSATGGPAGSGNSHEGMARHTSGPRTRRQDTTVGWRPSCACCRACDWLGKEHFIEHEPLAPIPCTVLDPFGGSGTVGVVADELGRDAVLIELSPTFAEMCERRVSKARARRLLGADAPRVAPLPGQLDLLA